MKKKLLVCLVFVLMLGTLLSTDVLAYTQEFAGSVGPAFRKVGDANTKDDDSDQAAVNWKYSDRENHRMKFRIVNSNGSNRGGTTVYRPNTGVKFFNTSAQQGYHYYLRAARENVIDPFTYVSGYWAP